MKLFLLCLLLSASAFAQNYVGASLTPLGQYQFPHAVLFAQQEIVKSHGQFLFEESIGQGKSPSLFIKPVSGFSYAGSALALWQAGNFLAGGGGSFGGYHAGEVNKQGFNPIVSTGVQLREQRVIFSGIFPGTDIDHVRGAEVRWDGELSHHCRMIVGGGVSAADHYSGVTPSVTLGFAYRF